MSVAGATAQLLRLLMLTAIGAGQRGAWPVGRVSASLETRRGAVTCRRHVTERARDISAADARHPRRQQPQQPAVLAAMIAARHTARPTAAATLSATSRLQIFTISLLVC